MSAAGRRSRGPSAIALLEDAVHVLRAAPPGLLLTYYAGTLPFLIAFLAFWSDMSASAFARSHCGSLSFGVAGLFVWMKAWQAAYCGAIGARKAGETERPPLGLRGGLGLVAAQSLVQSVGLVLVPAALLLTLPAAWTFGFFQSFGVLGRGERRLREEIAGALREAGRWPAEQHVLVLVIGLLYAITFVNVAVTVLTIPFIGRTLLGIETAATRGGLEVMFNTTFLATALGLTYALVDPVVKACYAIRCFHGISVRSGLDLRTGVEALRARTLLAARTALAAVLVASLICGVVAPAVAGEAGAVAAGPRDASPSVRATELDPRVLDVAIHEVLERPEFAWRLPRAAVNPGEEVGFFEGLIRGVVRAIERTARFIGRAVRAILDWVEEVFPEPAAPRPEGAWSGWRAGALGLGYTLLALSCALLGVLAARAVRRRRRSRASPIVPAPPPARAPDIRDESVTAADLPEDGWAELARELLLRGERRSAVRALYLAGLAHLARRGLIVLARHKSNREYQGELRRRESSRQALLAAFADLVLGFERVWYGMHDASDGLVAGVASDLERMRSDV